jgi:5-methylcytosine-specific restriction protein A
VRSNDALMVARNRSHIPRIDGRELTRIRERWRFLNPLCAECERQGRVRLWVQLDHIIPLSQGGTDDDNSRQGLCKPCHAEKTARERGYTPRAGCDANGFPLSPSHHWVRPKE